MGRSVNKVQLIGTLGRDPELSYMTNGNAVANLSIATDESYNDKTTGQKVERTEWHNISAFGKLAEIIGQYLKKGSKVYFEGKLKTDKYEKDGVEKYSTKIVAFEMMMLDSKPADGMQPQQGQQPAQGGYSQQGQPPQQPQQGQYNAQAQAPQQRPAQQPQQGGFAPQNGFDNSDIPFA
jgi:single-strand DNA-binding protein